MNYGARLPTPGETLKRPSRASGLTQNVLADASGISIFSIRGYEQGKRIPNDAQRIAIAKALGVPPEVLTDFGVTNPDEVFRFLRELAHTCYMVPQMGNIGSIIAEDRNMITIGLSKRPSLEKLLKNWYFARVEFQITGDAEKCQDWQDRYER